MKTSLFQEVRSRLPAPRRIAGHGAQEAAVAVILAPGPEGLRLLLIHRAEHPRDPWSGQIGLPGGRRERADADLFATAVRETREELSLRLREDELLGELDDLLPGVQGLPKVLIRPFVFGVAKPGKVVPSAEVDGAFWAPLRGLRASEGIARVEVRRSNRAVPAFLPDGRVVWGITHRILKSLLGPLGA